MKRYIRASFDASMPSWLKDKLTQSRYPNYAQRFVDKYGIALSDAKFTTAPTGNALPIYNIVSGSSRRVYIPGLNDDEEIVINNRYRKLGKISKSTLEDLVDDVVYVDLSENRIPKKESYKDPRYSYYHNFKGRYAGQYYDKNRGEWRTQLPSNEVHSRDKSGYQVPSPESQLRRYYQMFPEKITAKVDKLYNRILEVRDKVLAPELINTPRDYNENMSIGNAMYRLRDAIDEYRNLLADLKKFDSATADDYYISQISDSMKLISDRLDEAEHNLTSRW